MIGVGHGITSGDDGYNRRTNWRWRNAQAVVADKISVLVSELVHVRARQAGAVLVIVSIVSQMPTIIIHARFRNLESDFAVKFGASELRAA